MRTWQWQEDIYGAGFHLVEGSPEEFENYLKKTFNITTRIDGYAHTRFIPERCAVVIWLQPRSPSAFHLSTVAHEAFHATTFVLNYVGLRLADESDEAFAYYLGYVVRSILTRLGEKPRRRKR